MQYISQPSAACLPVTALHVVELDGRSIVLSGAGSYLHVDFLDTRQNAAGQHQIFACQHIHGIVSGLPSSKEGITRMTIVIWGGKLLCVAKLSLQTSSENATRFDIRVDDLRICSVEDWVLSGLVSSGGRQITLLTAHNALYRLKSSNENSGDALELELLVAGLPTLLYSGHILELHNHRLAIASGTVFGEILYWTCSESQDRHSWRSQTRRLFLGHRGSVFGVCISKSIDFQGESRRLLASCSDDRTIRIWDITDSNNGVDGLETSGVGDYDTGFGTTSDVVSHVAMVWAHLSRIWGIRFVQHKTPGSAEQIGLLSRGEDGTCQSWHLELQDLFLEGTSNSTGLQHLACDRYHHGKNCWSLAHGEVEGQGQVVTGGADGQIISRPHSTQLNAQKSLSISLQQMLVSLRTTTRGPGRHGSATKSFKQYLIINDRTTLATTDDGLLLKYDTYGQDWSEVVSSTDSAPLTLSSNCESAVAYISQLDGSIWMYDANDGTMKDLKSKLPAQASWIRIVYCSVNDEEQSLVTVLLVNLFGNYDPRLLTICRSCTAVEVSQCLLNLPSDFVIASGILDLELGLLICGSRAGALTLFREVGLKSSGLDHVLCVRHIHCSDSVTSIVQLPSDDREPNPVSTHLLTTGRDGTYAIHHVRRKIDDGSLMLDTVHRATPPLGSYLEGAYLEERSPGLRTLFLYGFKSKNFIVWNESQQVQLSSIDCGGAHRSWHYTRSTTEKSARVFVWSKAGTFNIHREDCTEHAVLQSGGHGREIKSIAIHVAPSFDLPVFASGGSLIATGAEDTDIRLFAYSSEGSHSAQLSKFQCLSVIKGHTTGVQGLKFSPCGKFLFSSGGCEEFLVWRLHGVPLLGIGTVLIARLPKEIEDSDARIMSFDIIECDTEYTITMAYSNGKAKVFGFTCASSNDKYRFQLLHQYNAGEICLTQATMIQSQLSKHVLLGATDGAIRIAGVTNFNAKTTSHRVHQSNIAAICEQRIRSGTVLVVTGGDDNALGISILSLENIGREGILSTILVPDAHAAALTALAVVEKPADNQCTTFMVVSAGNDQRVKLWRIHLVTRNEAAEDIVINPQDMHTQVELELLSECWTDVADVSNIALISAHDAGYIGSGPFPVCEVMVVGVGMQVLSFSIRQ